MHSMSLLKRKNCNCYCFEGGINLTVFWALDVGEFNLTTATQIAQLALKHCQNKNQRQRIIVFAGRYSLSCLFFFFKTIELEIIYIVNKVIFIGNFSSNMLNLMQRMETSREHGRGWASTEEKNSWGAVTTSLDSASSRVDQMQHWWVFSRWRALTFWPSFKARLEEQPKWSSSYLPHARCTLSSTSFSTYVVSHWSWFSICSLSSLPDSWSSCCRVWQREASASLPS